MEKQKHIAAGCRKRHGEKRNRKTESDIIDSLMLYVGYKSRKHVIRELNHTFGKRKRKPRGRRKIITPPMLEVLREIRAMQGYPCPELLKASLPEWLEPGKIATRSLWENRRVVQEHFGDVKFDDEGFIRLLNRFYRCSNLILNLFSPCMYPVSKRMQGGKDYQAV